MHSRDCVNAIVTKLSDVRDVVACGLVNKLFNMIIKHDTIWEKLIENDIQGYHEVTTKKGRDKYIHCYGLQRLLQIGNFAYYNSVTTLGHVDEKYFSQNSDAETRLSLFDCHLTKIPKIVEKMARITKLYLNVNNLFFIQDSLFRTIGFTALTVLNLSHNKLQHIPQTICFLKELRKLYISNNFFVIFPEEILCLSHLETLTMNSNFLRAIPSAIARLGNLSVLDISDNKIRSLPDEIYSLTRLEELYVGLNDMITISPNVSNIGNSIRTLDFSNNRLIFLPSTIGNLDLEVLCLENNNLESLPDSITKLSRLEKLFLENNRLSKLPNNWGNMKNLQILCLNYNLIQRVPQSFIGMTSLRKLDLSHNCLGVVPDFLYEMTRLEKCLLKGQVARPVW